jgi:hypothetical protein
MLGHMYVYGSIFAKLANTWIITQEQLCILEFHTDKLILPLCTRHLSCQEFERAAEQDHRPPFLDSR